MRAHHTLSRHRPRKRATQYSEAPMMESIGRSVLDTPLSRSMTIFARKRRSNPDSVIPGWSAGTDLRCEFAQRTAPDIRRYDRYINPARHRVRAFAVGWELRMTGSTRSSSGLDDRRKRLLFRCWHRGTREMDLLLGRFADAEIAILAEAELAELERVLEIP